jgi:hypothetical protein
LKLTVPFADILEFYHAVLSVVGCGSAAQVERLANDELMITE